MDEILVTGRVYTVCLVYLLQKIPQLLSTGRNTLEHMYPMLSVMMSTDNGIVRRRYLGVNIIRNWKNSDIRGCSVLV